MKRISKIWFRSSEGRFKNFRFLAMQDSGTLELMNGRIRFWGRKKEWVIEEIKNVTCSRQGVDFVNKWVVVEYGEGKKVYFADGKWFGWSGILGGTSRLSDLISSSVEARKK